jgi:hypothetical protein
MAKNPLWSRREILRGVGVIGLGTLGIFSALNKTGANAQTVQPGGRYPQKGPVGSWFFEVQFSNGEQERVLGAFTSDGILILTVERNKAPGYGVWSGTGSNRFTYKFREPIYEVNGNLFGEVYVVQQATLNSAKDSFESTGTGTIYDLNGNIISTDSTTVRATRIK